MNLNIFIYSAKPANLNETIKHLEHIGVTLAKKKEISEFGKFIWIEDPEGRLVELWEK
jgi:glyoxylase I family protein